MWEQILSDADPLLLFLYNRKGREDGGLRTENREKRKANGEWRTAIYVLFYCDLCVYVVKKD